MVVLRIVLVIVAVIVAAFVGAWAVSGERRYLAWSWFVCKIALIVVGLFLVLLALEAMLRVV